jgi:endonuclease/exonuclease/phosphatase family metal-dependent hydrolase
VTAAAGAGSATTRDLELDLMSFNIRFDNPADGPNVWSARRELVANVIRAAAPDIVGLQEAQRNQLDDLAAGLRSTPYVEIGVGRDDGATRGEYSPLLYRAERLTLVESGTFWLSPTPEVPGSVGWGNHVPRICTWARFEDRRSGRRFYAFNSHFDHESAPARARAAEAIAARIAARPHPEPVFMMGDFNATEDDDVVRYLIGTAARPRSGDDFSPPSPALADTYRVVHPTGAAGTFNGWGQDTSQKKIDYILAAPPPATEVRTAVIDRATPGGRFPSDHFPLTVHLRVPQAPAH